MALISIPDSLDNRVSRFLIYGAILTGFSVCPVIDKWMRSLSSGFAIVMACQAWELNAKNKPLAIMERARVESELNVVGDFVLAQEVSQTEEIQSDLITQVGSLLNPLAQSEPSKPAIEPSND